MTPTAVIRRIRLQLVQCDGEDELLADAITDLLCGLGDGQRRMVWRHAYWRMPDVPDGALRAAAGGEGPLRLLAGHGPVVGRCGGCRQVLRAGCRAAVELPAPTRCDACARHEPAAV